MVDAGHYGVGAHFVDGTDFLFSGATRTKGKPISTQFTPAFKHRSQSPHASRSPREEPSRDFTVWGLSRSRSPSPNETRTIEVATLKPGELMARTRSLPQVGADREAVDTGEDFHVGSRLVSPPVGRLERPSLQRGPTNQGARGGKLGKVRAWTGGAGPKSPDLFVGGHGDSIDEPAAEPAPAGQPGFRSRPLTGPIHGRGGKKGLPSIDVDYLLGGGPLPPERNVNDTPSRTPTSRAATAPGRRRERPPRESTPVPDLRAPLIVSNHFLPGT